jgi:hypothetical protein
MFFQPKKNPPPDSLLAVGSVDLLKSVLLHPFPSSRRHVIRVDIPVPVDVIRVDLRTRELIKGENLPKAY